MKKILCALAALSVLAACNKDKETTVEPTSVSLDKHDLYLATEHYIFKNDQAIYSVPQEESIYSFCVTE